MSKKSQKFLQPVLDDLKVAFQQAGIPLRPIMADQRANDDNKYALTVMVGDDPLFEEGHRGEEILQEISNKHKEYLGLDFTETIGTCKFAAGRIDWLSWN